MAKVRVIAHRRDCTSASNASEGMIGCVCGVANGREEMTTPTADERVAEIEARAKAATPGPWELYSGPLRSAFPTPIHEIQAAGKAVVAWTGFDAADTSKRKKAADADFIAHAREDIPYLLSALRKQQAETERLREALRELLIHHGTACSAIGPGTCLSAMNARRALAQPGQEGGKETHDCKSHLPEDCPQPEKLSHAFVLPHGNGDTCAFWHDRAYNGYRGRPCGKPASDPIHQQETHEFVGHAESTYPPHTMPRDRCSVAHEHDGCHVVKDWKFCDQPKSAPCHAVVDPRQPATPPETQPDEEEA